ncbi:MAG: hypothetical protein WCI92_03255 [Bacteroidota bacterium]
MHLLAVSLLTILAGTLLLAKTKKEELGKFFKYISWFFLVVGFLVFIGFIAGGICKFSHGCMPGKSECRQEIIMKDRHHGMNEGNCCAAGMGNSSCEKEENCAKHDSTMKCCPGHLTADTSNKMCCPKSKQEVKIK